MDEIDKKILQILQENARSSLKYIGENTYLSSPAVSSRIAKLEQNDVITGYHAAVEPANLGYHITAFVSLKALPGEHPGFYERMREIPNVLELSCVTGEYPILMKAAFPGTAELNTFVSQLQRYGKTSVQIVLSTPVGPRGVDAMIHKE